MGERESESGRKGDRKGENCVVDFKARERKIWGHAHTRRHTLVQIILG